MWNFVLVNGPIWSHKVSFKSFTILEDGSLQKFVFFWPVVLTFDKLIDVSKCANIIEFSYSNSSFSFFFGLILFTKAYSKFCLDKSISLKNLNFCSLAHIFDTRKIPKVANSFDFSPASNSEVSLITCLISLKDSMGNSALQEKNSFQR